MRIIALCTQYIFLDAFGLTALVVLYFPHVPRILKKIARIRGDSSHFSGTQVIRLPTAARHLRMSGGFDAVA